MNNIDKKDKLTGFVFVILAGIGFGFLGIFGKLSFQSGISVGELLVSRFLIATILLWLFVFFKDKTLFILPRKQILISSLLGVFGYAVFSSLYFHSIQGLSISLAAMLLFTFPLFVNLGNFLIFRQKLSRRHLFGTFLSFIGLIVLLWGPLKVSSLFAIGSALLAALTYAIYVIVSGHFQKNTNAISSSLYVIACACIGLMIFHRPDFKVLSHFNMYQLNLIMGLSVLSTIIPIIFFLKGMQKIDSSIASVVVTIEPVVAALAGWFILNEGLTGAQIIGGFLVLISFFYV